MYRTWYAYESNVYYSERQKTEDTPATATFHFEGHDIHEALAPFVEPPIPYGLYQEPTTLEQARRAGTNCYRLVSLICAHAFAYELPWSLRGFEMFHDRQHLRPLPDSEPHQVGDLVWLGHERPITEVDDFQPDYDGDGWLVNWRDFPVTHVGMVAATGCDPTILHASQEAGRTTVQRLSSLQQTCRYARLYARQRLRVV